MIELNKYNKNQKHDFELNKVSLKFLTWINYLNRRNSNLVLDSTLTVNVI